jgi:hypothetical protein
MNLIHFQGVFCQNWANSKGVPAYEMLFISKKDCDRMTRKHLFLACNKEYSNKSPSENRDPSIWYYNDAGALVKHMNQTCEFAQSGNGDQKILPSAVKRPALALSAAQMRQIERLKDTVTIPGYTLYPFQHDLLGFTKERFLRACITLKPRDRR